ncbi:MAG TPA: hypothetical protein ENJ20_02080 [Bacteroidetes bacterium]|nr:hypothetical protein [Bacteroidota bacterium]
METTKLTPQESLELISRVIGEAKSKYEENGFLYILWGVLIAIAGTGQFVLLHAGYENISYYPYFLMPVGFLYTIYYISKKKKTSGYNPISKAISISWAVLGLNMMLLGFIFHSILQANLLPVILLLQGIGLIVAGAGLSSRLLLFAGIFSNMAGLFGFWLNPEYHPLLTAAVAIVAILVPGIILMYKNKNEQGI